MARLIPTNKNSNPKNPTNSGIMQALLDMQASGFNVQGLIEEWLSDTTKADKAEALFKSHQYPLKSIKYAMLSNSLNNNIIDNLSDEAKALLLLLIQNMHVNNHVSLTNDLGIKLLKYSKSKYMNAKRELRKYGCITTVRPYAKGKPEILMVNPEIAYIGKNQFMKISEFWESVNDEEISNNYSMLNIPTHERNYISERTEKYCEIVALSETKKVIDFPNGIADDNI